MVTHRFPPVPCPLLYNACNEKTPKIQMSVQDFETSNLDWQLQKIWQQLSEWVELQLSGFGNRLGIPDWVPTPWVVELTFWVIVSLLVVWMGWQLVYRFYPALRQWNVQVQRSLNQPSDARNLSKTIQDWLRQAQKWQQLGNYREACRALYMAMLQQLNDTQQIPHAASRTDGEYLTLVRQLPDARSYQTLIQVHEQLCFSDTPITSEIFQQCQQAFRQIEGERRDRTGGAG